MLKVVLAVFLVTSLAQIFPSCGGGDADRPGGAVVIGVVEGKRITPPPDRSTTIFILGTEYDVPRPFWLDVNVGDLVKWDGTIWTIVRRGG